MSTPLLFFGDSIAPGSQPVLVFPILARQDLAAIDLTSTWSGTGTITGLTEGSAAWAGSGTDSDVGVPPSLNLADPGAGNGLIGYGAEAPQTGLIATPGLTVTVSKDGGLFAASAGALSEIGSTGYYKYVPATTETDNPPTRDSSNTGLVVVSIQPVDPFAITNTFLCSTMCYFRLRPPGLPLVNINPGQAPVFLSDLMQPTINDLKNFIRSAIRDLLGNQLTNKPTFRKDS